MNWFSTFKGAARSSLSKIEFDNLVSNIKTSKSGIHSIDDTFKNLNFSHANGGLLVNNVKMSTLLPDLRMGNIRSVFEKAKVNSKISVADENALKRLLKPQIPEFDILAMNQNIRATKSIHPDLHVKAPKTGSELKQMLDPKSRLKIVSVMGKIKAAAGNTARAIGLIATVSLGIDIYDALVEATHERNGCYLLTKTNGKTVSCKLLNRSCASMKGSTPCASNQSSKPFPQNAYIMLQNLLDLSPNSDAELLEIKQHLALSKDVTKDTFNEIVTNHSLMQKLEEYYKTKLNSNSFSSNLHATNPCELLDLKEGCVACDPSAPSNSPRFVDTHELPVNCAIQCIQNSTVLDTIVDLTTELGVKLFDVGGSASQIFHSMSKIIYIFIGLFLVAVSVSLYLRFFRWDRKWDFIGR